MKYIRMFLPTHNSFSPEISWNLWFEEFMELWKSYCNAPPWETWDEELFELYRRLASDQIGKIDWSPYIEFLFPRFMGRFSLPGTTMSNLDTIDISIWIIATIGGSESGRTIQNYLRKMVYAIESYFQPVNSDNQSANNLHLFIICLCEYFIRRLHNERYDTKRKCATPVEKRLTDSDVENFILGLKPVIFHIIFNEEFDSERHYVFNSLSTIRPDLIIPTSLEKFKNSMDTSMTEPHSFTACLATLRSCARPLVENYPLEVIQILKHIIPGIDINDIWKSSDILLLVNSFLEMIWLIDFSGSETK
jgi:proteasome activator subunit 4